MNDTTKRVDVERFNCTNGKAQYCYGCYEMTSDNEYGEYVRHEDYAALLQQLAERDAEIERRGDWRSQAQLNAHLFHGEQTARIAAARARDEARSEIERLTAIINTPQADDFLRAVSIEAEHQRQRWGSKHDAGKTAADWFWLIGYLAGKALHSATYGDNTKAEHHIITTAAACANWHKAVKGETDMRPGTDGAAMMTRGDG